MFSIFTSGKPPKHLKKHYFSLGFPSFCYFLLCFPFLPREKPPKHFKKHYCSLGFPSFCYFLICFPFLPWENHQKTLKTYDFSLGFPCFCYFLLCFPIIFQCSYIHKQNAYGYPGGRSAPNFCPRPRGGWKGQTINNTNKQKNSKKYIKK